jgi:hypothetical protein
MRHRDGGDPVYWSVLDRAVRFAGSAVDLSFAWPTHAIPIADRHVKEAARTVQHMQKIMVTTNVQLSNGNSDISGVTGQAIIRAILSGEQDPATLVKLRDRRIKATQEEVACSLEGNWREDMLFEQAGCYGLRFHAEADKRIRPAFANPHRRIARAKNGSSRSGG